MLASNRPVVYSLLAVVLLLLLGIMAMLSVADQRHQRLEDQATDLKRHLFRQQQQIKNLKGQLKDCDTMHTERFGSSSWSNMPASGPMRELSAMTRLSHH